jgi:hypothetical protein
MAKKVAPKKNPPKSTKTTKAAPPRARAAPVASAASAVPVGESGALRGELTQLANIRAVFPALSEEASNAFFAQYSPESCRKRAESTKARDVFRGAMSWARTFGENAGKPGVDARRVRWFLDCASALGAALSGQATVKNPSLEARYADVVAKTTKLLDRTKRRARQAVGSSELHLGSLREATASEGEGGHAQVFRNLAALFKTWLEKGEVNLVHNDIDETTVQKLESAAADLEAATARRPAAQQSERDSPATNELEGRLLFAMRPLWDDLAEAREDGQTALLLTVSPAILRGLGLRRKKSKAAQNEADEEDDGSADT